jgi:hypothetical protein
VTATGFAIEPDEFNDDADAHVALIDDGTTRIWQSVVDETLTDPQLLRAALETVLSHGEEAIYNEHTQGVGFVYWVDGNGQLHATWTPDDDPESGFEGDAPALTEANMSSITFATDGSQATTSAYVQGESASGYYRGSPRPWAGDLEALVTSDATTDAEVQSRGRQEVQLASSTDGTAVVHSSTPLDYRPGMRVAVTSSLAGLSGETFRITGVTVDFETLAQRTYTIKFGGTRPANSGLANLVARIAA